MASTRFSRAITRAHPWRTRGALRRVHREQSAQRATRRELITLAAPIAAAMLGESMLGIVDTRLVGALGAEALAGVGTASVLMYLAYALGLGLMRGVKVHTAYAIGEGRPQDAPRYAQAGALFGLGLGAVIFALTRDATRVFLWLGVSPAVARSAAEFTHARAFGAPAMLLVSAMVQSRQAQGDSRSAMIAGLATNVVNATLAYALIHGALGAPALGVSGAGYATAIAEWIEALGLLAYVARCAGQQARTTAPSALSLREAVARVWRLGAPTGAHFFAENLAFTVFTLLLGAMGAAELAAHQLALSAVRVSFLPGFAVAEAASVLVGRSLGRGQLSEADRVARAALRIALGFMGGCSLVFVLWSKPIARFFTQDSRVVPLAAQLLLIAAIFQVFDGANMVLRGLLRGAKDVRFVAIAGTTIAWICIPGLTYVLGRRLHWGATGGWWGFVAETVIATIVLGARWIHGPFRRAHIVGTQTRAKL
ncbi:MAG: MATE family efflux transporter [Deltaproteobacteria bacterium]|nr:MATE family efflux transporter [Deltaproteobacteria bacterium]